MFPQSPTEAIRWDQSLSIYSHPILCNQTVKLVFGFNSQHSLISSVAPPFFFSPSVFFSLLQDSLIGVPLSPAHKDTHSPRLVTWRCKSSPRPANRSQKGPTVCFRSMLVEKVGFPLPECPAPPFIHLSILTRDCHRETCTPPQTWRCLSALAS